MINPDSLARLRALVRKGDYVKAAQIYRERYKKPITPRHLQYFIAGESAQSQPPDDRRHDPLKMLAAVSEAISTRQARERDASKQADALINKIITDTSPLTPIAQ